MKQKQTRIEEHRNRKGQWQLLSFDLPEQRRGNWKITHEIVKQGTQMTVVSMRNALFMRLPLRKMTLEHDTIIHALKEQGAIWMTSTPQEIEQATRQLERASGSVLVGGLGLGLAVSILQRNPKVKQITVVENSQEVCKMVWPHVLLHQRQLHRLRICGLYEHLACCGGKKSYDFAFYDIWCPTGQNALYEHVIPLRCASRGVVRQQDIECWNEEEMLGQLRMNLALQLSMIGQKWKSISGLSIMNMTQKQFEAAANSAYYRKYERPTMAFYNWARRTKASQSQACVAIESFIAALKAPSLYDEVWRKWEVKSK